MKISNNLITISFSALYFSFALSGCSTLNKKECINADWASIGYQDGFDGHNESRIGQHREACAEYGVKPVLESYLLGYNKGSYEYCRPFRGYQHGLKGKRNKNICKAEQRQPYNQAYSQGKRIYDLEDKIKEIKTFLDNEVLTLKSLKKERLKVEHQLISDGLTKQNRILLVQRLRALDGEQQSSIKAISDHENLLRNSLKRVKHLRKSNAYKTY